MTGGLDKWTRVRYDNNYLKKIDQRVFVEVVLLCPGSLFTTLLSLIILTFLNTSFWAIHYSLSIHCFSMQFTLLSTLSTLAAVAVASIHPGHVQRASKDFQLLTYGIEASANPLPVFYCDGTDSFSMLRSQLYFHRWQYSHQDWLTLATLFPLDAMMQRMSHVRLFLIFL